MFLIFVLLVFSIFLFIVRCIIYQNLLIPIFVDFETIKNVYFNKLWLVNLFNYYKTKIKNVIVHTEKKN